jgi:hypothetical protein
VWIGDPAEIKAKRVKKQKFDREDARLLLRLLRENNFPQIWVADAENRDLRQLLWHRHRLVQMRTRILNQLHANCARPGSLNSFGGPATAALVHGRSVTGTHFGCEYRRRYFVNFSPNMGSPLFDSALVASSWITSQCSRRTPSLMRRMSAAIQFVG